MADVSIVPDSEVEGSVVFGRDAAVDIDVVNVGAVVDMGASGDGDSVLGEDTAVDGGAVVVAGPEVGGGVVSEGGFVLGGDTAIDVADVIFAGLEFKGIVVSLEGIEVDIGVSFDVGAVADVGALVFGDNAGDEDAELGGDAADDAGIVDDITPFSSVPVIDWVIVPGEAVVLKDVEFSVDTVADIF